MSRINDYDYDEDFPNQAALWRANADRALKGKRGRRALTDLRDALLALPQKRLIEGALCTVDHVTRGEDMDDRWGRPDFDHAVARQGEGVCAVGAYIWWQKVKAGTDPATAFAELPTVYGDNGDEHETTAILGKRAGLAFPLAWDLAYMNDEQFAKDTPEQRYERFMTWLDRELGAPA
jgi:hypothetical protein